MNIAPLTPSQRRLMIARLGEGFGAESIRLLDDSLSDAHLRTCYEGAFHEPAPAAPNAELVTRSAEQAATLSAVTIDPVGRGRSGFENEAPAPLNHSPIKEAA